MELLSTKLPMTLLRVGDIPLSLQAFNIVIVKICESSKGEINNTRAKFKVLQHDCITGPVTSDICNNWHKIHLEKNWETYTRFNIKTVIYKTVIQMITRNNTTFAYMKIPYHKFSDMVIILRSFLFQYIMIIILRQLR